ncbi:MAG: HEPN domain-containing protein [Sphaerochaetaceae bacterium]|nr:HEPN domain-containing protein [Sphaerochaetaceae bacterium]
MSTIIDNLYNEINDIILKLENESEISLALDAKRHFTKIFVLSSASYFEDEIQKILEKFVTITSSEDKRLINFVRKKAILFQYHTYFDWGEKGNPLKPRKNANSFFAMFGNEFKERINDEIKDKEDVKKSIECFIELGHIRNILVHNNFAAYNNIPKTLEEFYSMYLSAEGFISFISEHLINNSGEN